MSLALLAPAALAGLVALAVPLALHVVRRAREREHAFAALRWIAPRARPRRRLRLEERALLALRLALVAGVVGLLAAPAWRVAPEARPWVLVAPGVDLAAPDLRAALATGRGDDDGTSADAGSALHWLAPGLPPITFDEAGAPHPLASMPDAGDPLASPSSLLRALDARLPPDVALQAWVPARLDGLDGERIALARPVDWRVLPASAGAEGAPVAIATARPRLALRAPPERDEAARVLAGVLRAWAVADGVDAAALDASGGTAPPEGDADVLAWLHPAPPGEDVRAWAAAGRTLLVEATADADATPDAAPLWRDDDGRVLASATPLGDGRLLRLHVALRTDALPALRAPGFPRTLDALLRAAPAPASGDAAALAPRHAPALAQDAAARAALDPGRRDLRPWLALLLGLLALAERALALRRGRWTV